MHFSNFMNKIAVNRRANLKLNSGCFDEDKPTSASFHTVIHNNYDYNTVRISAPMQIGNYRNKINTKRQSGWKMKRFKIVLIRRTTLGKRQRKPAYFCIIFYLLTEILMSNIRDHLIKNFKIKTPTKTNAATLK